MKVWHQSYETADGFGDDDDVVVRFPNPLASERHSWQLRNLTNDVAEEEEDDKGAHADAMMMMMMMMRRRRRRGMTKHMLAMVMISTCWQARQEVKLTRTSVLPILWQSERPRSGEECQNVKMTVMIIFADFINDDCEEIDDGWVTKTSTTMSYMYTYVYIYVQIHVLPSVELVHQGLLWCCGFGLSKNANFSCNLWRLEKAPVEQKR